MTLNSGADGGIIDDGKPPNVLPVASIITAPATTVGTVAAAIASQASTTSPIDGRKHRYRISVVVTITTLGSGSFSAEIAYTDDNAVVHAACIIPLATDAGAFALVANTANSWSGSKEIDVNPNTAITVLTAGTFTGCTYNFSAVIERIN